MENQNTAPAGGATEEQLKAALAEKETLAGQVKQLTADKAALTAERAKLAGQVEQLTAERAEQDGVIAELQKELEVARATKGGKLPVVSHGKDKYQVTSAKFHFGGAVHEAKDLLTNKELVKQLVEAKSGVLEKI